ncbi:uncharacterized protein LOC130810043 [Amaranthus tricolor]|uniref:uncharacterized protein LOC130810043 n=1 Tax=Amaranthus tricolor TaxID=29722 RepID=UPI0025885B10|nr:uncharacterized protein LOC130810043 [Amaranthus tricolor]
MASCAKIRLYLMMTVVVCTLIYNITSAEEDVDYEPGVGAVGAYPGEDHGHEGGEGYAGANTDPTHIVDGALLCFNGKHLYSQCDDSCRLTVSGELHVSNDQVDEFCSGPCLEETNLVLDCIDGIMEHFLFFNKATTQDIRDTIVAGCGDGDERGNFDVAEHIEADYGNGSMEHKATISILSGVAFSIIGQMLLSL